MSSILRLTEQLISRNGMPPDNADCRRAIPNRLQALGFDWDSTVEGPAS